eukprot:120629-Rhodomonas_salina.2
MSCECLQPGGAARYLAQKMGGVMMEEGCGCWAREVRVWGAVGRGGSIVVPAWRGEALKAAAEESRRRRRGGGGGGGRRGALG